jgi:ankyrin repeat protein
MAPAPEYSRADEVIARAQTNTAARALSAPTTAKEIALDTTDAEGRTALMLAAARGDEVLVRELLQAGVDVRRVDNDNLTAADHARRAGHEALARQIEAAVSGQR